MPDRASRTRRSWSLIALLLGLSASTALAQPNQEQAVILEAPVAGLMGNGPSLSVTRVGKDGAVDLRISDRLPANTAKVLASLFAEGYYLMLAPVAEGSGRFEVFRAQVAEIGEGPEYHVRLAPEAAAKLRPGGGVTMVHPLGATTARMRALPGIIPFAEEPGELPDPKVVVNRIRSVNNLKQIGLAMHNFRSVYDRFPAAVIYGPDGKPWHSWRVLILPFLEQAALYNEYDFNQPWDSEKNRKLIDRMPDVYRDPAYGDAKGTSTHYAALVGPRAFFPPEGARQPSRVGTTVPMDKGGRKIAEVTDGTSNTFCVAPVEPARAIPWTKPEDIAVGPDFPGLGKPGGIAAPYPLGGKRGAPGVAPILYADGSVQSIASTINPQLLQALMTYNGGEVIDAKMVPQDVLSNRPSLVKVRVVGKQATATVEEAR